MPALAKAPEFFKSNGFHAPVDHKNTPFQAACQTDLGFYEYIAKRPSAAENFHAYMRSFELRNPPWVNWFPVEKQILEGFFEINQNGDDKVLLVDVGGGQGHTIKHFREKFKHSPGRLILQDGPRTLAGIDQLDEAIEFMEYDFFKPQIVLGKCKPISLASVFII